MQECRMWRWDGSGMKAEVEMCREEDFKCGAERGTDVFGVQR